MFFTFMNRFLTILLLAGSTLCLLFVVFSGSVTSFPFNTFYWISVDTSSISTVNYDASRYTFWGLCNPSSYDDSHNGECSDLSPDYPFSPYDNFGNFTGIPQDFIENRDTYYYLSRFGFPMMLVALIFSGVAFICSFFQIFWISMKNVMTFFVSLALLFGLAGASCETAVTVMIKNKFTNAGFDAKLDAAMYGLTWAAMACLIISFFLCCCSNIHRAYRAHKDQVKAMEQGDYYSKQYPAEPLPLQPEQTQPVVPTSTAPVTSAPAQQPITSTQTIQSIDNDDNVENGIRFFKVNRKANNLEEEESIPGSGLESAR